MVEQHATQRLVFGSGRADSTADELAGQSRGVGQFSPPLEP
jgi:hypothetical protein